MAGIARYAGNMSVVTCGSIKRPPSAAASGKSAAVVALGTRVMDGAAPLPQSAGCAVCVASPSPVTPGVCGNTIRVFTLTSARTLDSGKIPRDWLDHPRSRMRLASVAPPRRGPPAVKKEPSPSRSPPRQRKRRGHRSRERRDDGSSSPPPDRTHKPLGGKGPGPGPSGPGDGGSRPLGRQASISGLLIHIGEMLRSEQ